MAAVDGEAAASPEPAGHLKAGVVEQAHLAAVKAEAEADLHAFIRHFWSVLEPGRRFVDNWHLRVLCRHLEAVTDGRIVRLLINVPPGTMKSLTVSVFWPAWEWGPRGLPHLRTIGASYAERLAIRDNLRCRRLVGSDWYRRLWGERVALSREQNAKHRFETTAGGFRLATSVGGLATGERGDRFVIDDPHNVRQTDSEAVRAGTLRWFEEVVPTRLNDLERSAIVVVMQRVHVEDISGLILGRGLDYEHLMLPMEFEPARRAVTCLGVADERREEGELLWPERFSYRSLERLRRTLGGYAAAGQLQQRPVPRGGGLFKRHWFPVVEAAPAGCRWIRAWDLAASLPKPDRRVAWTAGVRLGRAPDGRFYVADVVRLQGGPLEVERALTNAAAQDGAACAISLPQDPGQAGKAQVAYLLRRLAGYRVSATPETGDKVTRATPVAAQAEAGNLLLVRGAWNEDFLEEVSAFPLGATRDQVDALSRAFAGLLSERPPQIFA